jgi:hypothetical protein
MAVTLAAAGPITAFGFVLILGTPQRFRCGKPSKTHSYTTLPFLTCPAQPPMATDRRERTPLCKRKGLEMSHSTARLLIVWLVLALAPAVRANAQEGSVSGSPASLRSLLSRLQFLAADGYNQYRYVDTKPHKVTTRDLLYKVSTVLRVSLVGEDTTYLQARGESGRSFPSSYDYTGIGMNKAYWSFNLKSLFLGQKIGSHWEAQAGGIEYDRGAGTEATYADNDGWLEGYRLRFTPAPHKALPGLISATVGYAGDFTQPNAFARLPRMGDENYIQILARKQFGASRDFSAEYDSLQSIRYTREALHLRKLPLLAVDELVAETITRASDDATFGWSGSLFKTLDRKGRVRLGAFISDMPKGIFLKNKKTIFMNGDSYVLGERLGPTVRIIPVKNFEVSLFGSDRLDKSSSPRHRGQVAVCYHFGDLLNRSLR